MATVVIALLVVALLAFVPDPFGRERRVLVTLDQVDNMTAGTPVYFRGAEIGEIRSIDLVPATRTFDVALGIRRDWQPSACTFLIVAGSNPFTQPRLELEAVETSAAQCGAARVINGCLAIPPNRGGDERLTGCRRAPDLIALASSAVIETAAVARNANSMLAQMEKLLGENHDFDVAAVARNLDSSIKSMNAILASVDKSMTPGRGDLAQTLANVRRASGQAASINVLALNQTLASVRDTLSDNRAAFSRMMDDGQAMTGRTRDLLESISTQLKTTSDRVDALTERLSGDPSYLLRGQRYADPPPPGGKP